MRSFIRRHRRKLIVVLVLFSLYVVSYIVLSRRGIAEAEPFNSYFFYVPIDKVDESPDWEDAHFVLVKIYAPLNYIDRNWLAGKCHCRGITRGLSK